MVYLNENWFTKEVLTEDLDGIYSDNRDCLDYRLIMELYDQYPFGMTTESIAKFLNLSIDEAWEVILDVMSEGFVTPMDDYLCEKSKRPWIFVNPIYREDLVEKEKMEWEKSNE